MSALCIERPIATVLAMVGLALAGIWGFWQLPVAALPQVDAPTLVITTLLPGTSPTTMTEIVTVPLERQLGQLPSLLQMTSTSSLGASVITLQFRLERLLEDAEQDVQAALEASRTLLPASLITPPVYSKNNPADAPILTLALTSDTLAPRDVDDFADSILVQKLSQVSGVGLVSLGGGQKPAVRVAVDTQRLAAVGLTLEDIRQAIMSNNINTPKGTLDSLGKSYTLATNDQLISAAAFGAIVLNSNSAAVVRLKDVAVVEDSIENMTVKGFSGNAQAVIVSIQRQPGGNIIEVVDAIKQTLAEMRPTIPHNLHIDIVADRTETIRAAVAELENTLLLTMFLVIGVIYFFLGSFWATLIPAIVLPLTLLGTFLLMNFWKFSLNNLTFMALTIATGFVVDDAIVMLENIMRLMEEGISPKQAALQGSKQMGFTIVSLTVSLIAVFIPLLFMSGFVGRLFFEFAMTLTLSIVVSAFLSLTLTPMMCATVLPSNLHHQKLNFLLYFFEKSFDRITQSYAKSLVVVLKHSRIFALLQIVLIILSVVILAKIPKGFFPLQDTGIVTGLLEGPASGTFDQLAKSCVDVASVLQTQPEVAHVAAFMGADGINPQSNTARFMLTLVAKEKRDELAAILAHLTQVVSQKTTSPIFWLPVQDLEIDSRPRRTQYQLSIEDSNTVRMLNFTPKIVEKLSKLSELQEVSARNTEQATAMRFVIDRDKSAYFQVRAQSIGDTLYDGFGERIVSTMFTQLNQYRVILTRKLSNIPFEQTTSQLYVKSDTGLAVPLASLGYWVKEATPLAVFHHAMFQSSTIDFNVAAGVSLSQAVSAIDQALKSLQIPLGLSVHYVGAVQAFLDAAASQPLLLLAALVCVYLILGILYESVIHPLTILSTLPSAGLGALWALQWRHMPLDVVGIIGLILLIGIVKKNAIMMIDFALQAQRQSVVTPYVAILQACRLRFRPIMMTTIAALLGGIPLVLTSGIGAELRWPLGITLCGGLLLSQWVTLYTTPVVYLGFAHFAARWRSA